MRLGLGLGLVRLGKAIASFVRDGLKLYYPFRDNDPELLLSGATSFDGSDDYINAGADSSLNLSVFTISLWVNFADGAGAEQAIRKWGSNRGIAIGTSGDSTNKFRFQASNSSSEKYVDSSTTVVANTWYHLTGTADGSNIKLYVNGSLENTVSSTITLDTASDNLYIGGFSSVKLNGKIANFGIWNRSLSSSEIESIYWKGQFSDLKGTELTNLVSWYNLKETGYGSELVTGTNSDMSGSNSWVGVIGSPTFDVNSTVSNRLFIDFSSGNQNINLPNIFTASLAYKITLKLRLNSGTAVPIQIGSTFSSGSITGIAENITPSSTLTEHTIDITSASGTGFSIGVLSSNNNGSAYEITDVKVQEVVSPDSTGTNNGSIYGATTLTDAYSASSPFLPRIQDKASDTVANYGEVYGGNAVSFDGSNDYIESGASNSIITGTNVTYSFWIKSTDTDAAYVLQNQKGAGSTNLGVRINNTTGIINLLVWDGSSHNALDAVTTINDSKWHHVAFTTTASAQVVYIDGKQDATSSNTFNNSASSDLFQIGRLGSGSSFFGGSLSALKVFSEVLTQDQVRELYTKPELTLPTGISSSALKLDMPMQEGSGTAILDGSPTFLDVAVNGDFSADAVGSTSVTGWSLDDFTAEVIADGYSGNAVQLTRVDSGTQSFYQDLSGITSGNKYKINVKLKAIGGSVSAGIRVTTPTNSNPSSNIVSLPADGSWEDVELSFTAQGTTARIQIQRQESDPGSIVVDDVIINQLNLGQNHGTGNGITWATGQEYGFQHSLVRSNNPMVFDGADDKVSVGTPSALNNIFTGGGTLSAWINPKSDGQNNAGQAFDKVKYAFQVISESSGSVKVQFAVTLSGGAARWETPLSVPLNTWTHILVTYDSDNPTTDPIIYLNGSAVTLTETISPSGTWVSDASSNLTLGNRNDGVTTFDGLLNDLAIWSSTLTANEVTALYNSGLPLLPTTDSGNYASSSDLVGYWRNDGVITWTDRSTNSNNGTVSGSPASIIVPEGLNEGRDSQGYYLTDTDSISSGIRFKGAEYISIEQSPSLNDISFSIEMWIKRSRIGVLEYVFKQGSQASANKRLHLGFNSGNKITFNFYSDDDVSSASIDNTNWNHIVWTFNSSNQLKTIYINGSSDSTATSDNNFTGDSLNTYLGTYNLSSFFFKGSIDEAKIYSKELSASEVLKNYNNGKSAHSN